MSTQKSVKFSVTKSAIITTILEFENYEAFEEWCEENDVECSTKEYKKLAGKTIKLPKIKGVVKIDPYDDDGDGDASREALKYLLKKNIVKED